MSSFELARAFGAWLLAAGALSRVMSASGTATQDTSFSPQIITVPAALRARNATLEPSGIVWAAALDRYLVVSDDTGQYADRHAPFVLALSRDGVFDEAPVPLVGIDELNDPEAICPGPDGTFFLSTSHSPNHRGHTRPARRQLLWLRLAKRKLEVAGRLDLTTVRAANGGDLLGIAGVPKDGRLDIEAIGYRDGALFIGLKSPLTTEGHAVVLRLADPAKALASGSVPAGALTRVAAFPLRVPGPQGEVAQGIADLLALPDGGWLVAANAPKGGPPDGGGAIYAVRVAATGSPGGAKDAAEVTLVKRFAGLKPEGLALSADGRAIAVVFDNDARPPSWALLPLPAAPAARPPSTNPGATK